MKKVFRKKIMTAVMAFAMIFSFGVMNVNAAETNSSASQPVVIGEFKVH